MWKRRLDKPRGRCTPCRLLGVCLCLLVVLIGIAALIIYLLVKPPRVEYLGVVPGSTETSVEGLQLKATTQLLFRVHNPNPIGVTLNKVEGTGNIPVSRTPVAFGEMNGLVFPKQSTRDVRFPLTIVYNPSNDKNFEIARYLLSQCASANQLTVKYTVRFHVVPLDTFGIVPSVERSAEVGCPDIAKIPLEEISDPASILRGDLPRLLQKSISIP